LNCAGVVTKLGLPESVLTPNGLTGENTWLE